MSTLPSPAKSVKSPTKPRSEYDERGRQDKALKRWNAQQQEWQRIEDRIGQRLNKSGDQTLQATTHHFRQRTEELGMIDASVPAEVKNGINAWEMNLRSGAAGGVRYVQVGSTFPYPLYCPIRDAEQVSPDSYSLMKVIPNKPMPARDKPVSESGYFKYRQHEFRRHVNKKFGHYTHGSGEPFAVEGVKAPVTTDPVPEDPSIEPIVFYRPPTEASAKLVHVVNEPETAQRLSVTSSTPNEVAATSATDAPAVSPLTPAAAGPMLMLSTAHLNFTAAPHEPVRATLRVDNIGSTAVFYSWLPVTADVLFNPADGVVAAIDSLPTTQVQDAFHLSDVMNGVFLPDDEKYFTFAFRSARPGVYTQHFELLTVPAGKERIVITLRSVVIGHDEDELGVARLQQMLSSKMARDANRDMLVEVLNREVNNVFDEANMRMEIEDRNAMAQGQQKAVEDDTKRHAEAWARHNKHVQDDVPFHPAVFRALGRLYKNMKEFLVEATGAKQRMTWNGSLRLIYEDASMIRDHTVRNNVLNCVQVLTQAASLGARGLEPIEGVDVEERVTKFADMTLRELFSRAAIVSSLSQCAEDVGYVSGAARDILDGRLVKSYPKAGDAVGKGADTKAKGAAAPAPKKAPAAPAPAASGKAYSSPASPDKGLEESVMESKDVESFAHLLAAQVSQAALVAANTMREHMEHLAEFGAGGVPIVAGVAHRMDEIKAACAQPEVELDPVIDAHAGKKKK